MLPLTAITEYFISVTSIKTMRARRIAGNFSRDRQLNDSTGGCHRSGRRFGADRNRGCGKWGGEETVVMHIPKSRVEQVLAFLENSKPIEMI